MTGIAKRRLLFARKEVTQYYQPLITLTGRLGQGLSDMRALEARLLQYIISNLICQLNQHVGYLLIKTVCGSSSAKREKG